VGADRQRVARVPGRDASQPGRAGYRLAVRWQPLDEEELRPLTWRPVEPETTYFHDIVSFDVDLRSHRGMTSRTDAGSPAAPSGGGPLWQSIALTISGGRPGATSRRTTPVRIAFGSVVFFRYVEAEFGYPDVLAFALPTKVEEWYETGSLHAAGFAVTEERNQYGAFCLWECDDSPFVEQLVTHWQREFPLTERRALFRHFRTSCHALGTLDVVARELSVTVLESDV